MGEHVCPWCGGDGYVIQVRAGYYGTGGATWARLRCNRPGCSHEWDYNDETRPAEIKAEYGEDEAW